MQGTTNLVDKRSDLYLLYSEDSWDIRYTKYGRLIFLSIIRNKATSYDGTIPMNLPAEFRPLTNIGIRDYGNQGFCEIGTNGKIRIQHSSGWVEYGITYIA